MPAYLLNRASVLMCPHGGTVQVITGNARAKAGGDFIVRSGDTFTIVGCPFMVSSNPHPCVRVQWTTHALRSKVTGNHPLTHASMGLCLAADNATQGAVIINTVQQWVRGD
jgi:hypothetical protein